MNKTTSRKPRASRANPSSPPSPFLDLLSVSTATGKRSLTAGERESLILMLAHKTAAPRFDVGRLAPEGSFLKAMVGHFRETDISHALPLFQTIMLAASWLTQNGAHLEIQGTGRIRPTLWTIGLAESGSSKTLAADRVWRILSPSEGVPPVRRLGMVASDAQWIIDLAESNGSFWFQDEVGKFVREMNTSTRLSRLKPWMLEAYSGAKIGNRLKGETKKLEIEDPHFTFHGMTVLSTWSHDVDATSMLDGWCQRMNYYYAPARIDTTMFDHFVYFEGAAVEVREAALRQTWQSLCGQPGASGRYALSREARSYLDGWWKGLEKLWGNFHLPGPFLRRIGFSTLRYLVVLQFLLGKSCLAIDVETAAVATAYAEYHMESALQLVQSYDAAATQHVRRVVDLRHTLSAGGHPVSSRDISRRLSKSARLAVTTSMIGEIVGILNKVELSAANGFPLALAPKEKADLIAEGWSKSVDRLKHNERRRNQRRLHELRKSSKARQRPEQVKASCENVIEFPASVEKPAHISDAHGSSATRFCTPSLKGVIL